jgi:4'-phosphopantetheinyl transferase
MRSPSPRPADPAVLFAPPPVGTIRVWLASLDAPPVDLESLSGTLSAEEHARASRFVFERDRRRFVTARGLLRQVVGSAQNVAAADVELVYGSNGRPAVAEPIPIAFNLSHSQDLVAIAIAHGETNMHLGVDIECPRAISNLEDVARSVYQESEMAALLACCPGDERLASFHRLWTRKEACMKATGAGFSLSPLRFCVNADAVTQTVRLPAHDQAPNGGFVEIRDLESRARVAGAVAYVTPGCTVEVLELF